MKQLSKIYRILRGSVSWLLKITLKNEEIKVN